MASMLITDLYTYRTTSHEDGKVNAILRINPGSNVYTGHFPGYPVTPGVCQVQMIGEILQDTLGTGLQLTGAKYIKFTAIHEPARHPEIEAHIAYEQREDQTIVVEGILQKEGIKFLKFKGEYTTVT